MRAALVCLLLLGCEPFHAEPTQCGGELVDLSSNDDHCGACGNACSGRIGVARGACVEGVCRIDECAVDGDEVRRDDDEDPLNGCEVRETVCVEGGPAVDVNADPDNCSACGHVCPRALHSEGRACHRGVCRPSGCTHGVLGRYNALNPEGVPVVVDVCRDPPEVACAEVDDTCDDRDQDCDGRVDEHAGGRSCGVGACRRSVEGCRDRCVPGEPEPERCNGEDDDCDGEIDEGLGEVACGEGACRQVVPSCREGEPVACEELPRGRETCDGIDEDCNGVIDDGLPPVLCGHGVCRREVPGCAGGEVPECVPGRPGQELCNGLDDDCDGATDEALPPVVCGIGACQRRAPGCVDGRSVAACEPGLPSAEVCNGRDDDCDGEIDEGLPTLRCGVGACEREVPSCVDGAPVRCAAGTAEPDVCNGVDDDCDGSTDEALGRLRCGEGACARSVAACVDGVPQVCEAGAEGGEICNGEDDDCDGETDEGFEPKTCGVGRCERVTPFCAEGREQRCVPGEPLDEICNGRDDDCDGETDEDTGFSECGEGACHRVVRACVGGVRAACVAPRGEREVCDGADGDCDGVPDARDEVCPGCVGIGAHLELDSWAAAPASLSYRLVSGGGTTVAAWLEPRALHVMGCDSEEGNAGRGRIDLVGLAASPLQLAAGPSGLALFYETVQDEVRDLRWQLTWHAPVGNLGAATPIFERITCADRRSELSVLASGADGGPAVELLSFADDCPEDGELALLRRLSLDAEGAWSGTGELSRRELATPHAHLCGAWRVSDAEGNSTLAVVTVPEAGEGESWRLDVLTEEGWSPDAARLADQNAQALVDERGCPWLVPTEAGLLRLTLEAERDRLALGLAHFAPRSGLWRDTPDGVAAQQGGAYLPGTFEAIPSGAGYAIRWQERAGDGTMSLRARDHTGRSTHIQGCAVNGALRAHLVGGAHPVLIWEDPELGRPQAVFVGDSARGCSGRALGRLDGELVQVAATPTRGVAGVTLYWSAQEAGGRALYRSRLVRGEAEAAVEVLGAVHPRGVPGFDLAIEAGAHHLLFLEDADSPSLIYRKLSTGEAD